MIGILKGTVIEPLEAKNVHVQDSLPLILLMGNDSFLHGKGILFRNKIINLPMIILPGLLQSLPNQIFRFSGTAGSEDDLQLGHQSLLITLSLQTFFPQKLYYPLI